VLEARDFLGEKGSNIVGIGSEQDIVALFMAGEIDMAIAYSGTMANLLGTCNCDDYNYSIPEEGSNIFVDNMFVPVDADSADLAMLFIDYTLNPEVSASLSNLGFGSVNRAATDAGLIDESFAEIDGFNPGSEVFARMFYVQHLAEDVAAAYDVAWDELLGFYGLPEE
jgi:spermidine/putrescine transport system substrate-binding protein